jgi:hypothetical protein
MTRRAALKNTSARLSARAKIPYPDGPRPALTLTLQFQLVGELALAGAPGR